MIRLVTLLMPQSEFVSLTEVRSIPTISRQCGTKNLMFIVV